MLLRKYEVYTVSEFLNKDIVEDISTLDAVIGNLRRNHKKYMWLVITVATTIDLSGITLLDVTVANANLDTLLSNKFAMIVEQLIFLAKYACMGMGLKDMIICLLNGGNMKEASFSGIQYWLGYLFLQFYPTLFN